MAGEPSSPLIKVGGCKNRALALNGFGWPERMIRSSRGVDRRRSAGCLYDRWLVGQRLAWRVGRHQIRRWRGVRERVGWIGFGVRCNGHDHFLELCSYSCYTRRTAMRRSYPSTLSHFAHQRRNAGHGRRTRTEIHTRAPEGWYRESQGERRLQGTEADGACGAGSSDAQGWCRAERHRERAGDQPDGASGDKRQLSVERFGPVGSTRSRSRHQQRRSFWRTSPLRAAWPRY